MATPENPTIYRTQNWEDAYKNARFGTTELTNRQERQFNRFARSNKGMDARIAFDKNEMQKFTSSVDNVAAARAAQMQQTAKDFAANMKPALVSKSNPASAPTTPTTPTTPQRPSTNWNKAANRFGFADMDAVAKWQAENGLVADGKFGDKSEAKWHELNRIKQAEEEARAAEAAKNNVYYTDDNGNRYSYANNVLTKLTADQTNGWTNKGAIKSMPEFRQALDWQSKHVNFGGIKWSNPYYVYNAFRDTNNAPDWNQSGEGSGAVVRVAGHGNATYPLRVWNDRSFALDYKTGKAYELEEDWFGEVDGRGDDKVLNTYDLYSFFDGYSPAKQSELKSQKRGGTLTRINYFQNGGAAPQQQDIKAQVVALVQAAMQGDQKATQQVNQIMEAAKAGDQQAVQIAQIMEQVVKELQGQAVAAKYGTKLNYLQSLKCGGRAKKKEKGGRVCPSCQGNI